MAVAGITLDSGALIGFDRGDRRVVALVVPAGVVAEVWKDGRRQANFSRLLASQRCDVIALDDRAARAAGQLCGVAGTDDVVDASVVLCAAARGHRVATSDPDDIRHLDPHLEVMAV